MEFCIVKNIIKCISLIAALIIYTNIASAVEVPFDSIGHNELPELNIVAIKQSGNLQNQPLSSTVVTRADIQIDNIVDIKSLSDIVPNFYIPNYGSRITSSIYVRGIGARMDQPSVGLTIDNLPVMNKDAYDLEIPDLSEMEMLRGPQSSLFGRNTMCGLINIRTLSPMRFQGLTLSGEVMTNKSIKLQGGWYHKFNETTGFSTSIGLNTIHGDHENQYNGQDVGNERSGNIRLKFEWLPTSRLSISNTLASSMLYQSGYAYSSVESGLINYNDTCFYRRFLISDVLTLNYNFDSWRGTGILSVQHIDDNMTLDQDFLPSSYFTLTQKKQATDVTAEFLGQRTGNHKYNWLGGVFAFYRSMHMQAPVTFKDDGIYNLIEHYRNQANPYYPIKWDSRDFLLNSDFSLPSFGIAAYHESRYSAGRWNFSAALRLDYERIFLRYNSYTNTSYTIFSNPSGSLQTPFSEWTPYREVEVLIDDDGKSHMSYLTLLPKVSVIYSLPENLGNLYATFGKGYKAGGYNTQMFSDVLQQRLMSLMGIGSRYDIDKIVKYKPEYSFNYEIGGHLDFSRYSPGSQAANLKLDFSLFYIDCRDQQLTMFPEGNTTGRIMTNAGKTRSIGGELSVWWNPWSTITFIANYGYTNARFIKYTDGKEVYDGNRLPYAPANTLFLQGLYTLEIPKFERRALIFDINLRGTGNIYWNEANTLKQPFYALLGASVTLKAPRWEIQLWGRNLTATDYNTFYFMSIGNEFLQKGTKVRGGIVIRITI